VDVSRFGPADWSKTVHIPGDVHHTFTDTPPSFEHDGIWAFRAEKMMLDLLHGSLMGAPLATVQVGDMVEGAGDAQSELDRAYAWIRRLPWPWAVAIGNHDLQLGDTAAWVAWWGDKISFAGMTSPNYAIDLGIVRVVFGDYRTTSADLSAMAALLAADTSKPTIVCEHKPLAGTLGTTSPRHGPEAGASGASLPGNEPGLRALLDDAPNARVLINGHTHNNLDTPGLVTTVNTGSRVVGHINCGAPYFLGLTNPDGTYATRGAFGDQVFSLFLEMLDDAGHEWAVHARDHGSGRWTDFDGDLTKRLSL
jgi:hypothetical protein